MRIPDHYSIQLRDLQIYDKPNLTESVLPKEDKSVCLPLMLVKTNKPVVDYPLLRRPMVFRRVLAHANIKSILGAEQLTGFFFTESYDMFF